LFIQVPKRKGGKHVAEETRSIIFGVRLTPSEKQALEDLAGQRGQNLSQFMRDLVLPAITREPNRMQALEVRLELLEAAIAQREGVGQ
jgi:uncharacterized protein (DUF1778 family)